MSLLKWSASAWPQARLVRVIERRQRQVGLGRTDFRPPYAAIAILSSYGRVELSRFSLPDSDDARQDGRSVSRIGPFVIGVPEKLRTCSIRRIHPCC